MKHPARPCLWKTLFAAEPPQWKTLRSAFGQTNLRQLAVASALLFVTGLCGTVLHLVLFPHTVPILAYAAAGVLASVIFLCRSVKHKHVASAWVRTLSVLTALVYYALAVVLSVFAYPASPAIAFILALILTPMLFDAVPLRNLLTAAPGLIVFLIFDVRAKPQSLFVVDLVSALVAFLAGQFLGLAKAVDRSESLAANARLDAVNYHLYHADAPDPLTGLPGREQAFSQLAEIRDACVAGDLYCNCIVAEVDGFVDYNARYGKEAGDRLLCALGSAFSAFEEETGIAVSRIGAATFLCVWADITDARGEVMALRLRSCAEALPVADGASPATVSIGLYIGLSVPDEDAYRLAGKALFFAKDDGGSRIMRFDDAAHTFRSVR